LVPIAGERAFTRLINGVSSNFVTLVFAASFVISVGAATNIRNRGSILAAFDEIGIDENGTDRHIYDGTVLRFLSEMASPSALSAQRVTSTAVATYPLEEAVRIYFAHPFAAIPRETAYLEKDVKQLLQVFAKLNASAKDQLATAGAATLALNNVTVTVTHGFDADEQARPEFIPTVRQQIVSVDSANGQLPEFIRSQHAIRAIVLTQEGTTIGEVGDIINSLVLRSDDRDYIGPGKMTWRDLVLQSEFEFGGAVVSTNRAHLGINFQQNGRLSSVVSPAQNNNLRFEFDCQPSVVVGAGASKIRITILELQRDPALTNPASTIPV
jgi:hypothetical protein